MKQNFELYTSKKKSLNFTVFLSDILVKQKSVNFEREKYWKMSFCCFKFLNPNFSQNLDSRKKAKIICLFFQKNSFYKIFCSSFWWKKYSLGAAKGENLQFISELHNFSQKSQSQRGKEFYPKNYLKCRKIKENLKNFRGKNFGIKEFPESPASKKSLVFSQSLLSFCWWKRSPCFFFKLIRLFIHISFHPFIYHPEPAKFCSLKFETQSSVS